MNSRIFVVLMLILLSPAAVFGSFGTIVTNLSLDNDKYYDIEIIAEQNGKILLPVKQIANILKIEYKVDNTTKEITFKAEGGSVRITKEDVYLNGIKINSVKNGYMQLGVMSNTRDEIYTTDNVLNKIFKSALLELNVDKSDLMVNVKTKAGKFTVAKEDEETGEIKQFRAYSEVLVPNLKKKISFNTLEFNNSMNSDSVREVYLEKSSGTSILNNSTQFSLKGEAYNGDLSIDFNTNNYAERAFSFGGLSFRYKNTIRGCDYELGRVSGFKDDLYSIGTDILGVQLYNYETNPKRKSYLDIEGKVAPDSVVSVYVDDEYHSTLDTYGGHYFLSDLYLKKEPLRIKVEEIKADETKQIVLEKDFASDVPRKVEGGINKLSVLGGVSGVSGRLFAQEGQLYQVNTKKLVIGIEKQYSANDNYKNTSRIIHDKIVSEGKDTIWGQSYYNANSILSSGTYQNPNVLQGFTSMNSLEYDFNTKFKARGSVAVSNAENITLSERNSGYGLRLGGEYNEKKYSLYGDLYQYSPKFYLAGAEGGFYSDRSGLTIGGSYRSKYFNAGLKYSRYLSNLDNLQGAGVTSFDDINFNAFGQIPKIKAKLKLSANGKRGSNLVGTNQNYYYDLGFVKTFDRKFLKNIILEGGQSENGYETNFLNASQRGFLSKYTDLYFRTDVIVPKAKGQFTFKHDNISYESDVGQNSYKIMKFGYSFPEFKRIKLYTELGYKYSGRDPGNTVLVGVGYRTKSDSVISVNYQYGKDNGYLIDNMYVPSNIRHSVNININDTLAFVPSGLKPVGYSDDSKGFIEIATYYDKNKNSKFDFGDIPVPNVPIKVSWQNEPIYSGPKGMCRVVPLDKGVYKVEVDGENLKTNLSASKTGKDSQLVIISPRQTTEASFSMTSTLGTVSGKLSVVDDFGREKSVAEHIVVLIDENDTEVAYTTVNKDGSYIMSGIEPGNYIVKLDGGFVNDNSLTWVNNTENKQVSADGVKIEIPFNFRKFVDITDVNLMYKSW